MSYNRQADDKYWNELHNNFQQAEQQRLEKTYLEGQNKYNSGGFNRGGTALPGGKCPVCLSTNLWDDNAHFGCNDCDAVFLN